MRIILLIVSFLIIFLTVILFYIGIYDEIYQELEKNKLWFGDRSFSKSLILVALSVLCSIYIFKYFKKKIQSNDYKQNSYSVDEQKMELIKQNKNFREYEF